MPLSREVPNPVELRQQLGWSQQTPAERAAVSIGAVRRMEDRLRPPGGSPLERRIPDALQAAAGPGAP
jgi:hypothetical protein